MKISKVNILVIAIVAAATVSTIVFISFFALHDNRAPCTYCPAQYGVQPIHLQDITTAPELVLVGDQFLIYANIFNFNPYPISFHYGCASPLVTTFDKNVEITHLTSLLCIKSFVETVNSGQQARIVGPGTGIIYNAISAGNTNATITFTYEMQGQTYNVTVHKQIIISSELRLPPKAISSEDLPQTNHITIQNQTGKDIILNKASYLTKSYQLPDPAIEKIIREKQQILGDYLINETSNMTQKERENFLPVSETGYDSVDHALEVGILPEYFNATELPKYFEKIRSIVGYEINIAFFPNEYALPV